MRHALLPPRRSYAVNRVNPDPELRAVADEHSEDPSDDTLLAAWSRGDESAFKALYHRHFVSVCKFFSTKVSYHEEVKDLVGDTFTELIASRARIAEHTTTITSFRGYLLGIAKHVLYRHLRRNYRLKRRGTTQAIDLSYHSFEDLRPRSLSSIVTGRRELDILIQSLRSLPMEDQVLLEGKYFEYLQDDELAALLEIPPTTLRGRLRRASARLVEEAERRCADRGLPRSTAPGADMDAYIAELRARTSVATQRHGGSDAVG